MKHTFKVGGYGDWVNAPLIGKNAAGYPVYREYDDGGRGVVAWFLTKEEAEEYINLLNERD